MKTQFPGYFPLSDERTKKLWNDCIFIFDANILLGLYRYSDDTRKEFFATLKQIKERCWLPHQAVKEYFNNRLNVIGKQEDAYSDIIKSMDEIEVKFKNNHQHPFLSQKVLDGLCKSFHAARSELEKSKSSHASRINGDDVLDGIEKIFGDRIGAPYSDDDLKEISIEGEDRYKKGIPPGFKDAKKDDDTDSSRKFGDLILWKQILKKAEVDRIGVVFVCDDRKDDWWLKFKGKTLGARPELIKEFVGVAGTDFHIYSSDRFLEFAGKYLGRNVSTIAVSEMRELKNFDEELRKSKINAHRKSRDSELLMMQLTTELSKLEYEYHQIIDEIGLNMRQRSIHVEKVNQESPSALTTSDYEILHEYMLKDSELGQRKASIRKKIDQVRWRINMLKNSGRDENV